MRPGASGFGRGLGVRVLVIMALLATALLAMAPAAPARDLSAVPTGSDELPNLDTRSGAVVPTAGQRALVGRLGASARWNRFGTPESLVRYGGYLATGLSRDPVAAARAWIRDDRALFRLSQAGVDRLEVLALSPMVGSPGYAVVFRQRFGSLPAGVDGLISVGVTRGRIAYVSSTAAGDGNAPATPTLSATDAWRRAAADAGLGEPPSSAVSKPRPDGSWSVFDVRGFTLPQRARLVAVPTPLAGVKTAFEVNVVGLQGGAIRAYTTFVDARSGRVLVRYNRLDHAVSEDSPDTADNPRWRFFPSFPALTYQGTDTRVTACWVAGPGCPVGLASAATRGPWDIDFATGLPTNTTIGNAATTAENWLNPLVPTPGQRPVSPTRDYIYPWRDQWNDRLCDPTTFTSLNRNDIDPAVTNLFVAHNRMHDWSYLLGFTEENSNLQTSNFGITPPTRAKDPEIGDTQAGGVVGGFPNFLGRDNANQITLQDGIPGITNQYLFQPIAGAFYSPCVDGDFDMTVVGHEYTHAISNRMIGGPDQSITSFQGGAMGESWSDLTALEYLHEYGLMKADDWVEGAYVTGNQTVGIRNYALDHNPLNYGDIGYDIVGPEVHADAEIWSATNLDIRSALNAKYDAQFPSSDVALQRRCANGLTPVEQCPGNRRWIQIVMDAYLLEQGDLSMLDARDAYLAADQMRFGGANQSELWNAFSARGMGEFASSLSGEDEDPSASFESPLRSDEATVTFSVVDGDAPGHPAIPAKVYVGRYEARVTPYADTDPTTPTPESVKFIPGTYDFVVQADGYGAFSFTRTFSAGQTQTLTVSMATNWASQSQGASASGDGTDRGSLIDDTEGTVWDATRVLPLGVDGLQVTVDLGGGRHTVRTVNVSAYISPDGTRFAALRSFEIWACPGGVVDPNCLLPTSFRRIYTSPSDAFPAVAPRPLSPDVQLRGFDVPDTGAKVIRLVVKTNQCTGGPDYQGEQDNDPVNITDCTLGAPDVAGEVTAAEFQAFSSNSSVSGS